MLRCSRFKRSLRIGLCLIAAASCGSIATAGNIYTAGHADIGVAYEDPGSGSFFVHFHAHPEATVNGSEVGNPPDGEEFEPTDITTIVPGPSQPRPAGSEFDFIGVAAGAPIWRLPGVEEPGVPFLGFASEELDPSEWTGDLTWTLLSIVSAPAGAEFSVWRNDIGGPVVELSTFNGVMSFTGLVGGHEDYNWAFTKPGIYQLEFGVFGENIADGRVTGSGVFTFNVNAVPEPGTLTMSGICLATFGLGAFWRRRKHNGRSDVPQAA